MFPSGAQFLLPDLFSSCPQSFGATNPHYKEARSQSKALITNYSVLSKAKAEASVNCCSELLCSRVYPYAGCEEFKTCCDVVHLLFVIDELSDHKDGEGARDACDIFYRCMLDPEFNDTSSLAKMTKEFRERFLSRVKPRCFERFLIHFRNYTEAVIKEAKLRESGAVLDLPDYVALRRENSAMQVCLSMVEYNLGIELPDTVIEGPAFQSVYWAVVDMVWLSNDVYSYNSEQNRGHSGNNFITVLMQEEDIGIQGALDRAGVVFGRLMNRYLRDKTGIPCWGAEIEIDADVTRYVDAIVHWVVGNLEWSFETPRYFGGQRAQVLRTRRFNLRIVGQETEDDGNPLFVRRASAS
ncbi:terpenoid synthase [Gyrodon lividus]|nr:terpenoid synthase [Gyrodon lividus]